MNTYDLTPLPADVRLIDALHLGNPHVIGVYLLRRILPRTILATRAAAVFGISCSHIRTTRQPSRFS